MNILKEIEAGGHEEAVDEAVSVLVRSGLGTKDLRIASEMGTQVHDAGNFHYAPTIWVFIVVIWTSYRFSSLTIKSWHVPLASKLALVPQLRRIVFSPSLQ